MSLYTTILNPKSGKSVSIFSNIGKNILSNFIQVYQEGGMDLMEEGLEYGVVGADIAADHMSAHAAADKYAEGRDGGAGGEDECGEVGWYISGLKDVLGMHVYGQKIEEKELRHMDDNPMVAQLMVREDANDLDCVVGTLRTAGLINSDRYIELRRRSAEYKGINAEAELNLIAELTDSKKVAIHELTTPEIMGIVTNMENIAIPAIIIPSDPNQMGHAVLLVYFDNKIILIDSQRKDDPDLVWNSGDVEIANYFTKTQFNMDSCVWNIFTHGDDLSDALSSMKL